MSDYAPASPGDRIPDFTLPDLDGAPVSLYDQARGKPIILAWLPALDEPQSMAFLRCARRRMRGDGDGPAHCIVITGPGRPGEAARREARTFPGLVLVDEQSQIAAGLQGGEPGAAYPAHGYVLDPNQRFLWATPGEGDELADRVFDHVDALPAFSESRRFPDAAPVLVIPRVLEPELCLRLIQGFHDWGHEESGVYGVEDGREAHRVDHSVKIRSDHHVRAPELIAELQLRLVRRVLPEIEKAFCYRVTGLEEFKIVRYRSAERGFFCPHRDNATPQAAHRRFAMTLNLNTDAYEGGALRFPEYGVHHYVPDAGAAAIFSCGLLHEATPVTRGERYVLLTFLLGADGA